MTLSERLRRRKPTNIRKWAVAIVATHLQGDDGCQRCAAIHSSPVVWPCLPVRIAKTYTESPAVRVDTDPRYRRQLSARHGPLF